MNSGTIAGLEPRTTKEVPTAEKPRVAPSCDVCGQREADGKLPDGRDACRPCARREMTMDTAPEPVDPDVGDRVLFESQGMELTGRVLQKAGSNLEVEVSVPESIVVEQVVEIVDDGGDP